MTLPLHILILLRQAGELLTPETQLRTDLRVLVTPVPSGVDVSEAFNRIESEKWALSVRDTVTGIVKWKITDAGRVILAERNL